MTRHQLRLEVLEDRTVPTVTLGTALGVGHELGSSRALSVVADAAGNSYMTGYFSGMTDFDPAHAYPGDTDILTSRGIDDAYVAKYAPDGSLVWAKRMGGDSPYIDGNATDSGSQITLDSSGNIYLVGYFAGLADFGSAILTSAGGRDGFAAKLNSSGVILWANRWGTTPDDYGVGVGVDAIGNVFAQGSWGVGTTITLDLFKFNSTGNNVWSKSIVTNGSIGQMTVDASGNVFTIGSFKGVVDFNPDPPTKYVSSGPSRSVFVLKLNTQGKFDWVSPFVGQTIGSTNGSSEAVRIALDGSGNVIVGGSYRGPVDFNPGNGTTQLPTIGGGFIAKLNSKGGLIWAKALESAGIAFVYGLAVDSVGSIYATGYFNGTVDFDPGSGSSLRTTAGGLDVFVMKLDTAGNFGWVESFGGTENDLGWGIALDTAGTIHLAGNYHGSVDFDPDPTDLYFLTNPGTFYNMFLVRLRQS